MFKWPGAPSAHADHHELADYAEILCWLEGTTSQTAFAHSLGMLAENDYSDGVPEEEEIPLAVESAFQQIERRMAGCDGGYPFEFDETGNALRASQEVGNNGHLVYRYLLLATRLNMSQNRLHGGIDGTSLFEETSAETARGYFGPGSDSMVFGTASNESSFEGRVNDLCSKLQEGDGYFDHTKGRESPKDGKLDVVLWKHFADQLPGKFIAFGQCKTGTSYQDTLTQLRPSSFCSKWLRSSLANSPTRMFFVSEALHRDSFFSTAIDAGLLFDRCRIINFSSNINKEVLGRIRAWTEAAAEGTGLPKHIVG